MRWKALAEIYTMHSFAPFSSLNFFVKLLRNFRHFFHNFCYFSVIFLDFFEILLKFCRNFWKFHGNPLNLQISMNFRGCRTKPGPKCGKKPSAARFARPLRSVEVLVAVRGPSPGEGGREKLLTLVLASAVCERGPAGSSTGAWPPSAELERRWSSSCSSARSSGCQPAAAISGPGAARRL